MDNLKQWTTITGPNSTNKSNVMNALALLSSAKMHNLSDISNRYKVGWTSRYDVPIEVEFLFSISDSFLDLFSDERTVELATIYYRTSLRGKSEDSIKDNYKMKLTNIKLISMKEQFMEALDKAFNKEYDRVEGDPRYQRLYNGRYRRSYEDIYSSIKYLHFSMKLRLSDGPSYQLALLNNNKEAVLDHRGTFHLIKQHPGLDDFSFAYIFGSMFLKICTSKIFKIDKIVNKWHKSVLSPDGSNIDVFIDYIISHHGDKMNYVYSDFKDIFDKSIIITKPTPEMFDNKIKHTVKFTQDNREVPLDNLSDGMYHVLRILLQINSCKRGDIIFIDEPELHLHPGAIKKLRKIIFKKKNECQIITTTHSPLFLDTKYVDLLILNQEEGPPVVTPNQEMDRLLNAIGSESSDILLYNLIIWCEGPSDKLYINKILSFFSELKIDVNDIGFVFYGGQNYQHIDLQDIKQVARKSFFILDSDKKNKDDKIKNKKEEFIKKAAVQGFKYWITNRKEIENYIPPRVMEKAMNKPQNALSYGHWDEVFTKSQKDKKYKIAQKVCEIIARTDFIEADLIEIKNELINPLNDVI
jgi:AAA15 family ATPase/GTPase